MAPLPGQSGADCDGKLSKAKIINETKWLYYFICEGCGLGPMADPLVAGEGKELCIRTSLSTTDIKAADGFCNQVEVCLCLTSHCSFPPAKSSPGAVAICGKQFGSPLGEASFPEGLFEESKVMNDTFWLMYCCCEGVGFNKMDQGLFSNQFKQLCCRGSTNIEPPVIEGVFCSKVEKLLCIQSECQCPPHKPNPTIACCTWRLNKDSASAPAQVEMK